MAWNPWLLGDQDAAVKGGDPDLHLLCEGVIKDDDGYGGFNVRFTMQGAEGLTTAVPVGEYHIHFDGIPAANKNQMTTKVRVIRYKASSTDALGISLYKNNPSDKSELKRLADLVNECDPVQYVRHRALVERLNAAWKSYRGV